MFSNRLKELRKQHRITQEELAKIIHVDRSAIGKYEGKSQVMPSNDVLIRISKFFNVSTDFLLDNDVNSPDVIVMDNDPLRIQVIERVNTLTSPELQRALDFMDGMIGGRTLRDG